MKNVAFLCTGNSARSILAEAILNAEAKGKFKAFSAGSYPAGKVNPFAIELVEQRDYPTMVYAEKAGTNSPRQAHRVLDFVFTVCDNAAAEVCPIWPGQPITAHWGVEDTAAVEGDRRRQTKSFVKAFNVLQRRISLFASLPLYQLDRLSLQTKLRDIGKQ